MDSPTVASLSQHLREFAVELRRFRLRIGDRVTVPDHQVEPSSRPASCRYQGGSSKAPDPR